MTPEGFAIAAVVFLLLPTVYFFMTSPTFLLITLDNPSVLLVLRALFNAYFILIGIAGVVGTLAFAIDGRPLIAVGMAVIAAFALRARGWFLREIDIAVLARAAGDADAIRRLRRLHLRGMAYNAVQLAVIASAYAFVVAA